MKKLLEVITEAENTSAAQVINELSRLVLSDQRKLHDFMNSLFTHFSFNKQLTIEDLKKTVEELKK